MFVFVSVVFVLVCQVAVFVSVVFVLVCQVAVLVSMPCPCVGCPCVGCPCVGARAPVPCEARCGVYFFTTTIT